ncbi:MAG: GNAT family N-acetyltransferase [Proteobacteria bacterium]|nr:GNAT family N-acetyltransferase [Pseudomonadota bacterium]
MSDDLRLVPARAEDEAAVLAFARAMNAEDGHPLDPAGEAAARRVARGEANARCWLMHRTGGAGAVSHIVLTIGFSIQHGGRDGFIDELYVRPEARGAGIGRRLLALAEREARALGFAALHLEVERSNDRARRLYGTLGYADNDRLLMSKRLEPPSGGG